MPVNTQQSLRQQSGNEKICAVDVEGSVRVEIRSRPGFLASFTGDKYHDMWAAKAVSCEPRGGSERRW